jgi:hypothetical protein
MVRMQTIAPGDTTPEDVPARVIEEAKAAFGRRTHATMAILVWDSLLDEGAPRWHHQLRFEHGQLWIQVSVTEMPGWSSLHGVVHPAASLRVELHSEWMDVPLLAEVTQRAFRVEHVPHGLVRLRLLGPALSPEVSTEWFNV